MTNLMFHIICVALQVVGMCLLAAINEWKISFGSHTWNFCVYVMFSMFAASGAGGSMDNVSNFPNICIILVMQVMTEQPYCIIPNICGENRVNKTKILF